MHVRTNEDMNRAILYGLRKIPRDVDLVVGIPRSGLLAGMLFSLYLNVPVTDLQGLAEGRVISTGKRPVKGSPKEIISEARKILVVDDSVASGRQMERARALVDEAGLTDKAIFLAIYCTPENLDKVDIFLEVVPWPRRFQWNIMHTAYLKECCVDIDGILCADPTPEQNDDGPRYRDFLRTAAPLFTPVNKIGWLVTNRLEKYRPETEDWMARHGITYENLMMMDYPSQEERRRAKRDAEHKAEIYIKAGAPLFIESSPGLAEKIASITNKPVLCFETHELYNPASLRIDVLHQKLWHQMQRIRRAPAKLFRFATGGRA